MTNDPTDTTGEKKSNKDLLLEAIANFDLAQQAYTTPRTQAREDLKFIAGVQQNPVSTDPYALHVNLLNPFLRQITSEARSANPATHIIPENDEADVDIAEARGGLIRAIEQQSDSEYVYQKALWYAAAAGEGYWFIDTEYISDDSFDQNLVLRACTNPEMVFLDPNHDDPTGEDSEWGFVVKDISHAAFKRQFPHSDLAKNLNKVGWARLQVPNGWIDDKTLRIAQYWVKQYSMKKIWQVQDPVTLESKSIDNDQYKAEKDKWTLLRKDPRDVQVCELKGYTITGTEVLEKIDWPGSRVPIFKVSGETFYIGNQRVQYGAIRHAVDPQRQYDYAVSRMTEMIDLAPKNSFVISTKQLGNNAEKWANANRVSYGYLDYVSDAGAQPPQRVNGVDPLALNALGQAREAAYTDIKRVIGLNDSSMGATTNDMSGVAQGKQIEQGSRSTYQFFDYLLLTIKASSRELNNLMPFFYDTDRIVRIVKPTNDDAMIAINSIANGKRYDFTKGQYSVTVSTGPAYASKRQEAYESLSQIMAALPNSGAVIGDLVASQVDSPIAKLAAARLKATIPPEVLAATGENDNSDMAPKEQVQQLQQQLAQAATQLKQADLEKQDLKIQVKTLGDRAALDLTKAEMENDIAKRKLQEQARQAQVDSQLAEQRLELERNKLKLAEQQLQVQAALAMHEVNEGGKPQNIDDVTDD